MRAVRWGIVVAVALAACKTPDGTASVDASAAMPKSAPPPAKSAATPPEPDKPMTTKTGEDGIAVTLISGHRTGRSAYLSFRVVNNGPEEAPISSAISFQATEPRTGVSGRLFAGSKCDGIAPPNGGAFACVLRYDFDSDAPSELRVRAEGAWFTVSLPEKK